MFFLTIYHLIYKYNPLIFAQIFIGCLMYFMLIIFVWKIIDPKCFSKYICYIIIFAIIDFVVCFKFIYVKKNSSVKKVHVVTIGQANVPIETSEISDNTDYKVTYDQVSCTIDSSNNVNNMFLTSDNPVECLDEISETSLTQDE
ncbi:hypothetical protein [Acanthamoeba castellanii mimivirus]|uniref:Uncharacterized protein R302 n=6 Tax=Mimivirus TaxID=315393 RepID=YR302_MIMIV|nr:hypothetical protein MIMI_gp0330 [Acanthamoeba polyphaga mimivirus]Q5UPZ1.1 RecName: Full=Uncharacterized protein R302 [Acanthamoeba polyphaga mimivirus]AHJ40029.1 hypothetical protein [Samba virus]ALR83883.1 hypothetical protein [Niemeyer virus]BAV61401.1 hypothetical protein [Acanthamoeba castellanii mimivirus]AAV50574.1 unknown [Acanthamoeba polyphaga mimivirus]ADO18545.1 hypothetical protein [Acanthamoeba polyphaga mimivirus]